MFTVVDPSWRSHWYPRKLWSVTLAVLLAVAAWCEAIGKIRDMQDRIRYTDQLRDGISELIAAADSVAQNRH